MQIVGDASCMNSNFFASLQPEGAQRGRNNAAWEPTPAPHPPGGTSAAGWQGHSAWTACFHRTEGTTCFPPSPGQGWGGGRNDWESEGHFRVQCSVGR